MTTPVQAIEARPETPARAAPSAGIGWAGALLALVALAVLLPLAGCVHIADQQSARLLDDGQTELTGSYSQVSFSDDGESEHVADYFGVRVGHGLSDRVELRGVYERIQPVDDGDAANIIGAGPKIWLIEDASSLYVPVGFASGVVGESSDTWTIAPTVLGTWRHGATFELTPSGKLILPFTAGGLNPLLGFNLGAAISTDLDHWAIRPEVGLTIDPGEDGVLWGWSLGLSFRP